MVKVNWYNANGNVSAKVRDALRGQVSERIVSAIGRDEKMSEVFVNANKGISIPIAETAQGELIYATLDLTITTADPTVKKVRKQSAKKEEKAVEETPNLFN